MGWPPHAAQAVQLGIPIVNVSGRLEQSPVPRVMPDNEAVGRLAARHLIDRGFRRMACITYNAGGLAFARTRNESFARTVREAGLECLSIDERRMPLANLPRPIGIFAFEDQHGVAILQRAIAEDLPVPDEVAVIGVNNDEALCRSCHPALASVDISGQKVGFEAARLLDDLLTGAAPPAGDVRIAPAGVVARGSTDSCGITDASVAAALQFIRDRATGPIDVPQVAEAAGICRRTLERRFREHLHVSIHEAIRRQQFEVARRLLAETDLKVWDIAHRCGFRDFRRFSAAFRRRFGQPPGRFRSSLRLT